jgi:transcriptional repressor NrdR
VEADIRVIKSPGRPAEEFQREKIVRAVQRVCKGLPVARGAIEALATGIEAELVAGGAGSVRSSDVAQMVLAELRTLNATAFERFAINYAEPSVEEPQERQEPESVQFRLF